MTNNHAVTRGRPKKPLPNTDGITRIIIQFLRMFLPETLAKRIVCVMLLAAGMTETSAAEATGLSIRTVWTIRTDVANENFDALFVVGHGSGRASKVKGLEDAIVEELDRGNYHTRQQVADMIFEKFNIRISVSAVGKLLKKTASSG